MGFDPNLDPANPDPTAGDGDEGGQPAPRRYGGGKYATLEEFEQAYSNSFQEVERIRTMQAAADARASMLESELNRVARERTRADEPTHIAVDAEQGVPRHEVARLAAEAARAAVAEAFQPLLRGANARAEMLRRHPDYATEEAQVQQHLAVNPLSLQTYNEIAQVNPAAALEFAFSAYRAVRPAAQQPGQAATNGRVAAGLPGNAPGGEGDRPQVGGVAASGGQPFNAKTYAALLKRGQDTNDWQPFLDYRLNAVVSDQHLGQSRG